jgi:hypothetical protein
MASIFTLENITDDFNEKINIDELYEKKKQNDINQLNLYNKILNRIHVRIKTTARQNVNEPFCWFVVPEIILGVPKYDQASCIAYLMKKLQDNGFNVKYIHPNALMIYWGHWVPSYVRSEIKKKTGIVLDEYGTITNTAETNDDSGASSEDKFLHSLSSASTSASASASATKNGKNYTPITQYKPTGSLIYDSDLLQSKFASMPENGGRKRK